MLHLSLLQLGYRQITQMCSNETPNTFFGFCFFEKTLLKSPVWFICRNDQVLPDGCRCGNCLEAALLLIKCRNIGHYKSGIGQRSLYCIPYRGLCIAKLT